MKKVAFTLRVLLSLAFIVSLSAPVMAVSVFPDVETNAVYAEAAEYLNGAGIMQGDSQGNFNPNKNVTRAQMAAIICRMRGETENLAKDNKRFTDVPATYWADGYISKAAELGIIGGYSDGTFKPDNTVTYEQAVTMIVRALDYESEAIAAGGYPKGYLAIAQDLGLLNSISIANGTQLNRGNVAMILFNCYHSYI